MRGGAYLAIRYGLGIVVSIGNMLVLTWWIGPHAYGIFVTSVGLTVFLANLTRAGIDTFLVRREPAPDARMYAIAGTVILIISLGLVAAGACLVPLLLRWYGSREFVGPYLVLLLNVPVIGLTGVPMSRLERELNFSRVAGIELGGQTLALLVSVTLAACRMGVWAPVAGQLAWQCFVFIAACASARFLPALQFELGPVREMLSYGIGITTSLRVWQLRTLVVPLLVARFAGAEGAAFVALALRMAEGLGAVRLAAGRLAIAALARLQGDRLQLRAAIERALYLQLITLGPLLCGFSLIGPLVVTRLMGERWLPCLVVYPFVAAGVLVNALYNLQASALFVLGRAWSVTCCCTLHVLLLAAATFWLLPHLGIAGYGWAELLACAPYVVIHRSLRGMAPVAYRKLTPWLAVFLTGLFLPVAKGGWTLLLGCVAAGTAIWLWRQRGRFVLRELTNEASLPAPPSSAANYACSSSAD